MKPGEFRYERPSSLADALALIAGESGEAAALAGGQSLMPMMNFRVSQPDLLVDLGGIEELDGISVANGAVTIGAMTRYATLAAHPDVASLLPLVDRALPFVAHSAIRNRGTLGGSLALADPAAEMPAVALALHATIHVAAPTGQRSIPATEFFHGYYETSLAEDELITAIEFPAANDGDRFGFHEVARRHGDYAMAGAAVALRDGQATAAIFAVADRAVRARGAEAALSEDHTAIETAVASLSEIEYAGDLNAGEAMKQHLAGVVLRRAWAEVAG